MILPELEKYRMRVFQEQQFQILENYGYTISHNIISDPELTVCGTLGCKRILRQVTGEPRVVYCPVCHAEAQSLKNRTKEYLDPHSLDLRRQQAVRSHTYFSTDDTNPLKPTLYRQVACWEPLPEPNYDLK